MKRHLADLQAKYTEKHPDILLTKKKIADLEVKVAEFEAGREKTEKAEEKEKKPAKDSAPAKPSTSKREFKIPPQLTPRYKELENQLIAADQEIQRLKQEDVLVRNQVAQYRGRIENTP